MGVMNSGAVFHKDENPGGSLHSSPLSAGEPVTMPQRPLCPQVDCDEGGIASHGRIVSIHRIPGKGGLRDGAEESASSLQILPRYRKT